MMPQAHRNPTSTSFRKSIRTDNGGSSEDIRDTFNVGLCLRHITYTHFRRLCEITHQIEIPPRRTNNHRIFSRALNKGLRIDGPIRTFCPSLACIFREKNNYNCTSRFPLRFVFPIHLIPANCKKEKKKKKPSHNNATHHQHHQQRTRNTHSRRAACRIKKAGPQETQPSLV